MDTIDILDTINRIPTYEREKFVIGILEQMCDRVYQTRLIEKLVEFYKTKIEEENADNDEKAILDEFCNNYGFDELIEELKERKEEEYEGERDHTV